MDSIVIRLDARHGALEIDAGTPEWCACWLEAEAGRRRLGAERLDYIVPRLRAILDDAQLEPTDEWLGYRVRHVLTLAEGYATLYASRDDSGRILLWQDVNANVIAIQHLSAGHVSRWRAALDRLVAPPSNESAG